MKAIKILCITFFVSCISHKTSNKEVQIIQYSLVEPHALIYQNRIINDSAFVRQGGYCKGLEFKFDNFKEFSIQNDTFYLSGNKLTYYYEGQPHEAFSLEKFNKKISTLVVDKFMTSNKYYLSIEILEPYKITVIDKLRYYIYKTIVFETPNMENYEFLEKKLLGEKQYEEVDLNYREYFTYLHPNKGIIMYSTDSTVRTQIIESGNNKMYEKIFKAN